MRVSVFFICLFALGAIAATAHAGDRAYYVSVVEIGRDASPEVTAHHVAFMTALLGCDSTEAACMHRHTNETEAMETTSNIALRELPSAVTNEIIEGVLANRAPARRAFAAAIATTDIEGAIVAKINARGVMQIYTLRRNGTISARNRYRPGATAPSGNVIRSVMRPIYSAFVP